MKLNVVEEEDDAGTNAFVGHMLLEPVHASATSHTSAAARQTVPAGAYRVSVGHGALPPVQYSGRSHAPVEARHTTPAPENTSTGHALLEPVQVSAGSYIFV